MKKQCIWILLLVCFLIVIILFDQVMSQHSTNYVLGRNEIIARFRRTVFLDLDLDVLKVDRMALDSSFDLSITNNELSYFNDSAIIQEMVDYLRCIPLALSARDEIPNQSPDTMIEFFLDDESYTVVYIYASTFIEIPSQGKIYRNKYNVSILDEIEGILTQSLTMHRKS